MKVALVRQQLRGRDMRERDCVMRGIGDHGVAGRSPWVAARSVETSEKTLLLNCSVWVAGAKVSEGDLAEVRREHEFVLRRQVGSLTCAGVWPGDAAATTSVPPLPSSAKLKLPCAYWPTK